MLLHLHGLLLSFLSSEIESHKKFILPVDIANMHMHLRSRPAQ